MGSESLGQTHENVLATGTKDRGSLSVPQNLTSVSSPSTLPEPAPEQKPATTAKPARRFAPQLIEARPKEHRGGENNLHHQRNEKKKVAFETNKLQQVPEQHGGHMSTHPTRRFTPQLISTAKRSFRQGNAVYPGYQYPNHMLGRAPKSAEAESRFSYASLLRRYEAKRRHSFQVPDLPAIESSSSDEPPESPASETTSPTVPSFSNNDHDQLSKGTTIESQSDSSFVDLVAQRTAAFLRNQALAAFPNEQDHQPVLHFAIDKEDDSPSEESEEDKMLRDIQENLAAFRRGSTLDLPWELEELRYHKHEAEIRERDRLFAQGHTRFSAAALAARQQEENGLAWSEDRIDGWAKNIGIQLQRVDSPPLLGDDIVFVRCMSPEPIVCEAESDTGGSTQAAAGRRATNEQDGHLWTVNHRNNNSGDGGLWNGTCKQRCRGENIANDGKELTPPPSPCRPGIVTPAVVVVDGKELGLPFRSMKPSVEVQPRNQLPLKPTDNDTLVVKNMDEMLAVEAEIQREFHDGFVTQIYNYLSLGYPCLARDYDEELSKISGIPVEELRKDDQRIGARGYLRHGTGRNCKISGSGDDVEDRCVRWIALKLYIHEWARQQPRMIEQDDTAENWGALPRRGSWGI
ncbi:hypothetical protein VTO42DRAFT_6569 [Malbranchea cinnamomea]